VSRERESGSCSLHRKIKLSEQWDRRTAYDFRAYPYSNPDDMLQSVKVSWGRPGSPAESTGEYAEQVRCMASQLLLERAH